jgi:hypothetical protein
MKNLITGKREALSNWVRQFVTIIDIEKRVYKLQESLFSIFKWGTFKPLPKIDYVLIFRSLFVKCEACSMDEYENNPNAYFQVSLVYNKNRKIVVEETRDKVEAFALAIKVASGLKARVRDSATIRGKSIWLD